MSRTESVSFEATLSAFGNNTGVVVPEAVMAQIDEGQRPPVRAVLNGHELRTTVGVMNGQHLVSVSKALRTTIGVGPGDAVSVTLTFDDSPREVEMPGELAAALAAEPAAAAFFEGLSNSLQRYHVDQVTSAKTDATRDRRVAKAVGLFLDGKQR